MTRPRRVPGARPPVPGLVLAVLAVVFFALPFAGLLWRVPWSRVADVLGEHTVRQALWISLETSLIAAGSEEHTSELQSH